MEKLKNFKLISIIAVILVVAIIAGFVLIKNKDMFFPEPTTTEPVTLATVRITFIEGQTMTEIFKLLEENGVSKFESLMECAKNANYASFVEGAENITNENICYGLEGYLFPDTYDFYLDEAPESVIARFTSNTNIKITDDMKNRASELGYSMNEILTIASIIQKEGAHEGEAEKVAGVIYNRLNDGMPLQMDTTYFYVKNDIVPYIENGKDIYSEYYDTYECDALPAGPICNSGMVAINAALYPEKVPYYYFCHDNDSNYYYAEDFSEHQNNCKKAGLS